MRTLDSGRLPRRRKMDERTRKKMKEKYIKKKARQRERERERRVGILGHLWTPSHVC